MLSVEIMVEMESGSTPALSLEQELEYLSQRILTVQREIELHLAAVEELESREFVLKRTWREMTGARWPGRAEVV